MSASIATSPDSGQYKYFLPENCEQYQKFDYDDRFLLGAFDDKSKFLQFLNVKPPKSVPDMGSTRGKESFLTLANNVAEFIKDEREHYLFLYLRFLPTYDFHFRFPKARCPSVPRQGKQITTWTRYGHNVQA